MKLKNETQLSHQPQGRISRRLLLQVAGGVTLSVAGATLLAACGGDDADATATTAAGEPTATSGGQQPTATAAMDEATATTAIAEPTTTEAMAESTATEAMADPSPTEGQTEVTEIYGFPIEPAQHEGGTLIRGMTGGVGTIPLIYPIYESFYERLTEEHPETDDPEPLLAEAWEVSDDGITWTFTVRQGVTFQNGDPLTPEDVVFSYDLKNKAGLYPNEPFASSSVATGPDHSVIFTLAQASPLVPKMANYYHIMSRNVLADLDPDTATFEDVSAHAGNTGEDLSLLITTGPFQLVELVRDDYMRFARYDGYWRGRPHLDEFVLRKIDDVGALTAQLQTGEIDVFGGHYDVIDPAVVADFEGSDVTVVQSEASYGAGPMISLNHRPEKTPLFQDVRVRQALLYALDRQAILDGVFFGYGTVSDSVVGIPAAFDTTAVPAPYSYDPALANQLLDEAGRALGADGIREKDGRRFQVDGYYEAGSPTYEAVVVVVQEYWRAVGIELVPSPEDASVVYERFGTGDYEVAFYVWSGNTPAFLADYFKSTSPSAEGGYGNPELDDLITAWQTEFDPDQRRALLTEIVNFIAEEVVFGIVCYQSPLGAVANRVHNYYPSPFNWFFNAHTWWVDA